MGKKNKKNIEFSIENLSNLKNFLERRDIRLVVVLYPWSFEIDDSSIGKKYLEFIIPLLRKNNIKTLSVYDEFFKGNIYENIGKYYLYNDIHFNKNGNKIIANNLIQKINQ